MLPTTISMKSLAAALVVVATSGYAVAGPALANPAAAASAAAAPLVPAITAEFIDPAGTRRRVAVADGNTTITGMSPFLVEFDASLTRAPETFGRQTAIPDPEAYAYLMVGYRINFGENLGRMYRWPVGSNDSADEETGPPLFSRVFTTAGTRNVRLRVKDTLGNESTLSFTVVVQEPGATINIKPNAERWPRWESGKRYTLNAGADYRRLGPLTFQNHHNIVLEKTGTGADPKIAAFTPDSRRPTPGKTFDTRSRHLRLVNIDVTHLIDGLRGYEYVGIIGGTLRRWTAAPLHYDWERTDETGRSNIRYPRGIFLQSTELRNERSENGYNYIGTLRGLHIRDTRVLYDGTQGGSVGTHRMLRLYGTHMSIRHNLYMSIAAPAPPSNCGNITSFLSLSGPRDDAWGDDDRVAPAGSTSRIDFNGYHARSMFLQRNQIYDKGSFVCNAIATSGGHPLEHDSPEARVRPRLIGFEDNVFGDVSPLALLIKNFELRGYWTFSRNNRGALGTGDYVGASTQPPNWELKDSDTFNGPYLIETENSRPLPSNF